MALHHIQVCLFFFSFFRMLFPVYEVLCQPREYGILQSLMAYLEVAHLSQVRINVINWMYVICTMIKML